MPKMYAENVKIQCDPLKRYPSEREVLKENGYIRAGILKSYTVLGKTQPQRSVYKNSDGELFVFYSAVSTGYSYRSIILRKFVGDPEMIIES